MNSYRIEPMIPAWIPEVARIHMESLPDDFLPGLGYDFLKDIFYPAALNSSHAEIYIAVEKDHPLGFVIITRSSPDFFRSIIQDRFSDFFKIGLKSSFSSLKQFRKNIEILAASLKKEGSKEESDDYGEIYEIAVKKETQGQGIGKQLVQASIDYLKQNEIPGIKIKTRKDNRDWIQFFLRQGWQLSKEFNLINTDYVILALGF